MIRPLGERVLIVHVDEGPIERESGLLVPTRAGSVAQQSEVVAVGDEVTKVQVGAVVLTTPFIGDKVEVNMTPHFLIEERDILAEVTPPIISCTCGPNEGCTDHCDRA